MTPAELRSRLSSGVIGFPVTPFTSDGALDLRGLKRNVETMAAHPFCALVAAGGTGELYSLTVEEHRQVVKTTVEATAGRMPIIAGSGGSVAIACEQARNAMETGAQGVLALPPYYPGADETGLLAYYRQIGEASPLGLLAYGRDWVNPAPAFVTKLADLPTFIAWKDGHGDARRYQILIEAVGDRLLWIGGAGDDLVPTYYRMGLRTYTSSISNVAPRLSLKLHELASDGNEAELRCFMRDFVIPLYAMRARRKGYEVSVMKAMMEVIGLAGGPVRPPLNDVTAAERTEIAAMVAAWKEVL
jgi:5-dehydro-4-deoxyglucarate dehydratase